MKSPGIKPKPDSKSISGVFHFGSKSRRSNKGFTGVNTSEDEQSPMVCEFSSASSSALLTKTPKRYEVKQETQCERQMFVNLKISQISQAPDAPTLLPRNAPAPQRDTSTSDLKHLAMRISKVADLNIDQRLNRIGLQLPSTSTIMMRRNLTLRSVASPDEMSSTSLSAGSIEKPNE